VCISLGGLWAVTRHVHVSLSNDANGYQLWMSSGAVGLTEFPNPPRSLRHGWRIERQWRPRTEWRLGHLTLVPIDTPNPEHYRSEVYSLPFWLPMLLVGAPTLVLWWSWYRNWRRVPYGHCPKCGYNLFGNTSGRCPECGEALPTAYFSSRDRHCLTPGHCRCCGYDLAGNVSGRCPECGTRGKAEGETR
jgi:predicted Zn-ribbon and HTH transcriptional regulator